MSVKRGTAANYLDLIEQLDAFLVNQGHAWGRTYAGTGTGKLLGIDGSEGGYTGGASSVAETFTLTATSATTFTVDGTVSGALADAAVGTPYTTGQVSFLIQAGGTPFVAGDTFTLNSTPPWQRIIRRGVLEQAFRTGVNFSNVQNAYSTNSSYAEATVFPAELRLEAVWPTPLATYAITVPATINGPTAWTLDYSDNGSTWTTADTQAGITWPAGNFSRTFTVPGTPGEHKHWRLRVTGAASATLRIQTFSAKAAAADEYQMDQGAFIAWRAPGADGTQEINLAAQLYTDQSLGTYNIAWTGSRFWDATKGPVFQVNASGYRVQYLYDSPMPFTFVANGHRIIPVVKVGTFYFAAYLGFRRSYDPPSADPWPCVVAANQYTMTRNYSSIARDMHNPWTPGRNGFVAHFPNGSWVVHSNLYDQGGGDPANDSDTYGKVYPAQTYSGNSRTDYVRDNIDGSYALIPCSLLSFNPRHAGGELDGMYWVSGFNNTGENVVTRDGFAHLCFPNINRTGLGDFAAIRMD